jgi:hypothetical protein
MVAQGYRKKLSIIFVCIVSLTLQGTGTLACTLWAVTGEGSKDGGSIIGQTWDTPRGTSGELRFVIPEKGFRYLGLFPLEAKSSDYVIAGVNEGGLVVVTAMADTISSKKKSIGRQNLAETILTTYGSVDGVLIKRDVLAKSSPIFLILGDYSKIALIQIGSKGRFKVETTGNGLFYHTNHYTDQGLLQDNKRYSGNSLLRRNRLQYLLEKYPQPLSLDEFLLIASDKGNGPDHSIWRTGSGSQERTLASWIVILPKTSPPEIYFKLVNPGSNELNYEIKLDKPFWTEGTE